MLQEPFEGIRAVVDSVLCAFNSKNSKLFNDLFSGEVAIIDGFAPFRWTGSNAQKSARLAIQPVMHEVLDGLHLVRRLTQIPRGVSAFSKM